MGLFGEKKICPICGKTAKGAGCLEIKRQERICPKCSENISMDRDKILFQSVEDIKEHLRCRQSNKQLFESFEEDIKIKCFLSVFKVDQEKKLWYFSYEKHPKNPPIFRYDEIINYEISRQFGPNRIQEMRPSLVDQAIRNGEERKRYREVQGSVKQINVKINLRNKYNSFVIVTCKNESTVKELRGLLDNMIMEGRSMASGENNFFGNEAFGSGILSRHTQMIQNGRVILSEGQMQQISSLGMQNAMNMVQQLHRGDNVDEIMRYK